jgi:hypothetical protein
MNLLLFQAKQKCTASHNYTSINAFSCLQNYTDLKDLFYDERPGYFEYAKETTVSVLVYYYYFLFFFV